ncbi:hypothetical protein C5D25_18000, partial [Rathayibacter sp. AY1D7]
MLPPAPDGRRSLADVLPGALDALLGRPGLFGSPRVERIVVVLVDGHGNFGSLDDGPAAARYTEARLAPAATAMT